MNELLQPRKEPRHISGHQRPGNLLQEVWQNMDKINDQVERINYDLIILPARVTGADGLGSIAAERRRQMGVEGWSSAHDDAHSNGELAGAAACYAMHRINIPGQLGERVALIVRDLWPWHKAWWKPKNRRADLVRAGALIAAEIDRLDRACIPDPEPMTPVIDRGLHD